MYSNDGRKYANNTGRRFRAFHAPHKDNQGWKAVRSFYHCFQLCTRDTQATVPHSRFRQGDDVDGNETDKGNQNMRYGRV